MYTSINHNLMAANTARNLNSHYSNLATSTQRLSSGLRINSAADDAAGLAIRELQRADIASLHQGARNANDAISMIQVADGALGIIDEKLIRMKELAEQAATGTYNSTQRLMIDSEFQAMASEINRIANATDFNGIKMLNGSLGDRMAKAGKTDVNSGIAVQATTMADEINDTMYLHYRFDGNYDTDDNTLNDSAATPKNLSTDPFSDQTTFDDGGSVYLVGKTGDRIEPTQPDGGYIDLPKINVDELGETFTVSITLNQSTIVGGTKQEGYISINGNYIRIYYDANDHPDTAATFPHQMVYQVKNKAIYVPLPTGGLENQWIQHTMVYDNGTLKAYQNGVEVGKETTVTWKSPQKNENYNSIGRHWWVDGGDKSSSRFTGYIDDFFISTKALTQEQVKYVYDTQSLSPNAIPNPPTPPKPPDQPTPPNPPTPSLPGDNAIPDDVIRIHFGPENDAAEDYYDIKCVDATMHGLGIDEISVETQEKAQKSLASINDAIVKKDQARAYYGALQNRLENTVSNLNIQAENLQAAESRISDVDVATEMTNFVRNQILTQSAVAMLGQANSMPQMLMQLIGS